MSGGTRMPPARFPNAQGSASQRTLKLRVAGASKSAVEAIERAGGSITLTRPVREPAEAAAE